MLRLKLGVGEVPGFLDWRNVNARVQIQQGTERGRATLAEPRHDEVNFNRGRHLASWRQ